MKVGVVGCGWVAEKHITFIRGIKDATIKGIADLDLVKLKCFSAKYGINNYYKSFEELIESQDLDVVHVLTPPFSHKDVALKAIERGVHVYIEKPIALTKEEVREICDAAQKKKVSICPGYNFLFDPVVLDSIANVEAPEFGDVIYVESFYGMNIRRYDRMGTTKENEIHWSFQLPGGFHQNYISHPIYMMLRFTGKPKEIHVVSNSTGALPQSLTDEIRVLIDGEKALGSMVLSYACEPYQHYVNIFGEKQAIKVDLARMTKKVSRNIRLPKAITKVFFDNFSEAWQLSSASVRNGFNLATKRLVPYHGMKTLIERFYNSIIWMLPSPISVDLMVQTEETGEEILKKCPNIHLNFEARRASQQNIQQKKTVLVTGASGYVGLATVKKLVEQGYRVRAFVRKLSHIDKLEDMGVEISFGDIRHYDSFKKAAGGIDIIVHLAAAMKGPADEFEDVTVGGVENLIRITRELGISKVIYMSSMSVYDVADCVNDQVLDENHILERRPEDRGPYSSSKTKAELLVLKEIRGGGSKWTVLRPSEICGPAKKISFNKIGFSLGNKFRVIIGPGRRKLRVVYIDDVVNAITLSLENNISNGKIYHVNYNEGISKKDYINNYVVPKYGKGINIYVPYQVFYLMALFIEYVFPIFKRKPFLTRYRLMSSQKDVLFSPSKIETDLHWKPANSLYQSIKLTMN